MRAKLKAMLTLQNEFNKKVNPDWLNAGYAWDQAIVCEATELLEHVGYKWWKKQEPNRNQMIMELVDIWHFGMSYGLVLLRDNDNATFDDLELDTLINELCFPLLQDFDPEDVVNKDFDPEVFKERTMYLINYCSSTESYFESDWFFDLWHSLGLTLDDLYKKYIGKNALNEFRQLNGYKDGSYIKIWRGREDNEHLTDILDNAELTEKLYDDVLSKLTGLYTIVKASDTSTGS